MPVNRRALIHFVVNNKAAAISLGDADFRAGNHPVVGKTAEGLAWLGFPLDIGAGEIEDFHITIQGEFQGFAPEIIVSANLIQEGFHLCFVIGVNLLPIDFLLLRGIYRADVQGPYAHQAGGSQCARADTEAFQKFAALNTACHSIFSLNNDRHRDTIPSVNESR